MGSGQMEKKTALENNLVFRVNLFTKGFFLLAYGMAPVNYSII